jgi:tetratricopeptide (TPR) repeat protein
MPDFFHRLLARLLPKFVPRSVVVVLLVLTLAATVAFAAVSHLVTRYNLNQQARGRKLYAQGLADVAAQNPTLAVEEFRAALTCDPDNPQYQLSLARALRDTGRLDEAESYLQSLWERTPDDGTINLALARVATRRGSLDDATRYYHNAMYGTWTSDADANRRKARIELIEFLAQKNATAQARSELVALIDFLPQHDIALHLQAAQLLAQAQDYANALSEYEKVHRLDHNNPTALAGAGDAAYHAGRYRTAQHYLQAAVDANSQDANSLNLLQSANLILKTDPFVSRISDAERNRRIATDFATAGKRLAACAQQKGVNLAPANAASPSSPLATLQSRWLTAKRDLRRLPYPGETDLPDTIMDVVFQIEQQTAAECGEPHDVDEALLLIFRDREAADQ